MSRWCSVLKGEKIWKKTKKYGLLTTSLFGPDGWILAKFVDPDGVQVYKLAKEKNEAHIQPSWSNKLGQ